MSKKFLVSILLVTGIMAGSAFAQSLVPLDPASISNGHVYLLEDTSGTDSSAVGLTGTAVGAPQPAEGLSGPALHFDGVADGINIPDSDFINVNAGPFGTRTLVAVFNCDDVDKPGKQTIFEEGGTTRGSIFYVFEGLLYSAAWNRAEYNWNGEWLSTPIGSGEWHAVAMVIRDGGEAVEDDKFEMWLDGQLIAKAPGGHLHNHGDNNAIGYTRQNTVFHDGNASPADGHYFGGIIDEVWILNVSLSEAELRTIGPNRTAAKSPSPANDGTDVLRDGTLSWEAGIFAQKHSVYLGTGFDDVNNATVAAPLGVLLSEAQDTTSIDPGRLAFDQTYYWRVDEVNGAPDFTVYKGDVWNFTIQPLALPVTDITATASSEFGASVADKTIDGSGLTGDLHGASANDMWISTGVPASIAWAFDRAYKLHEMWVWNSNQFIEAFIGFGAKDVVIEHSLDGENWTVLEGVSALAQAPGAEGYAANNIIDFGGVMAQHVRMNINTVQGFAPQTSLSEVRFLYIPTFATGPNPLSGATEVAADVTLSWDRDGREAGRHDIYLGSDPNTLALAGSVSESIFDTLA
ncbi:MAG: hypothetical protein IH892_23145, partial [Planctomycetes bacterium]|nr:hypothetical protein [Planctomycetota bacterium]